MRQRSIKAFSEVVEGIVDAACTSIWDVAGGLAFYIKWLGTSTLGFCAFEMAIIQHHPLM